MISDIWIPDSAKVVIGDLDVVGAQRVVDEITKAYGCELPYPMLIRAQLKCS